MVTSKISACSSFRKFTSRWRRNLLESPRDVHERLLDSETFEAGGTDKTHTIRPLVDIRGIFGSGNWSAMAKEQDVFSDFPGSVDDALASLHGLIQGAGGVRDPN